MSDWPSSRLWQAWAIASSDVEQALIAVQQEALRERYQREVVRAAQKAFDISRQRLQEGTLDMVTLTQTQQTLFTAQDNLAQIRLLRLQAIVQLYQALGGGWSPPERVEPTLTAAPAPPAAPGGCPWTSCTRAKNASPSVARHRSQSRS